MLVTLKVDLQLGRYSGNKQSNLSHLRNQTKPITWDACTAQNFECFQVSEFLKWLKEGFLDQEMSRARTDNFEWGQMIVGVLIDICAPTRYTVTTHHSTCCRLSNVVKYKRGQGIQQDRDHKSEVLFKPPLFNLIFKMRSPHCHKRICWDVVAILVMHSSISGGKREREDMSRKTDHFSCSNLKKIHLGNFGNWKPASQIPTFGMVWILGWLVAQQWHLDRADEPESTVLQCNK